MSQFRTSGDRFARSGLTLRFKGFEKLAERDSFRQIQLAYTIRFLTMGGTKGISTRTRQIWYKGKNPGGQNVMNFAYRVPFRV
jgi:hypothetical protein